MANDIEKYIEDARGKKASDEQIKATLLNAGWPETDVDKSLAKPKANPGLPPPPPPPVPHVGMWTGFLYIIFFISLYILASAIGAIFHAWIDDLIKLPDMSYGYNNDYSFWNETMPLSLASIIVTFPIFTILAVVLKKQLASKPYVRNLRARKLLIYLTLIGTFLIMIGHIITTLYNYLQGSGTANSVGHLLVTIIIAGSIFLYFLSEVKYDSKN